MTKKIGIYGGSFNPVHFGHIGLVKWVSEHTDLDEVWMLVSPNNPLKDAGTLADEQTRLRQVQQAVAGIPHVRVSDFEFSLPRPNYTASTLRALQDAYPDYEFTLIIGEDNFRIFTRWYDWQYILTTFRLFVYPRHQTTTDTTTPKTNSQADKLTNTNANTNSNTNTTISNQTPITTSTFPAAKGIIFLHSAPYFDISSTQLRNRKHYSSKGGTPTTF